MKKTLFILMLFIAHGLFSQITLEHTYTGSGSSSNDHFKNFAFFIDSGLHYYVINNDVVNIHSSDHSLLESITISLQAGYEIKSAYLFTDHLFNSDDNIEFILTTYSLSSNIYNVSVYDHTGNVIYDFGEAWEPHIINAGNGNYKILIETLQSMNSYKVYSLPGTLSVEQQELYNRELISYPVPANNKITINSPLHRNSTDIIYIYNDVGQIVLQKKVTGPDNIIIGISTLSSGMYIYRIAGFSGKFIKK